MSTTIVRRARGAARPFSRAVLLVNDDGNFRLLTDALSALPEAVAIFDDDDRFVFWNAKFAEVYAEGVDLRAGTRFEDHLKDSVARGLVPAAIGREEQWVAERLARFSAAEGAHEHRLGNGRCVRVQDRKLAHGGRIGIRTDVTDLADREQSARLLLEANPSPVIVCDIDTLDVLWVNEAAVRFYGYARDVFATLKVGDFRVEGTAGEIRTLADQAGSTVFNSGTRIHRTSSGERRIVKVTANRLSFEGRSAMLVAVTDVTEQHRMQDEVRRARNFLRQVIDQVPTAVFVKDMAEDGRFVIYNRASEVLFGHSREEAIGRSDHEVFGRDQAALFRVQDDVALRLSAMETIQDETVRRPDGTRRRIQTRKVAVLEGEDVPSRFVIGVCEDVTDRLANEARIAYLAHHDELTGLPNRYLFNDRLASALARVKEARELLAVLCIDLDGFKAVNDTWGHAAGDLLLRAVAERLRVGLRSCDTAARLGGDEFAILQTAIGTADEATRLAGRLTSSLAAPYVLERHRFCVSASIGVTLAHWYDAKPSEVLERADTALYRAKREGRNTYRLTKAGGDDGRVARAIG